MLPPTYSAHRFQDSDGGSVWEAGTSSSDETDEEEISGTNQVNSEHQARAMRSLPDPQGRVESSSDPRKVVVLSVDALRLRELVDKDLKMSTNGGQTTTTAQSAQGSQATERPSTSPSSPLPSPALPSDMLAPSLGHKGLMDSRASEKWKSEFFPALSDEASASASLMANTDLMSDDIYTQRWYEENCPVKGKAPKWRQMAFGLGIAFSPDVSQKILDVAAAAAKKFPELHDYKRESRSLFLQFYVAIVYMDNDLRDLVFRERPFCTKKFREYCWFNVLKKFRRRKVLPSTCDNVVQTRALPQVNKLSRAQVAEKGDVEAPERSAPATLHTLVISCSTNPKAVPHVRSPSLSEGGEREKFSLPRSPQLFTRPPNSIYDNQPLTWQARTSPIHAKSNEVMERLRRPTFESSVRKEWDRTLERTPAPVALMQANKGSSEEPSVLQSSREHTVESTVSAQTPLSEISVKHAGAALLEARLEMMKKRSLDQTSLTSDRPQNTTKKLKPSVQSSGLGPLHVSPNVNGSGTQGTDTHGLTASPTQTTSSAGQTRHAQTPDSTANTGRDSVEPVAPHQSSLWGILSRSLDTLGPTKLSSRSIPDVHGDNEAAAAANEQELLDDMHAIDQADDRSVEDDNTTNLGSVQEKNHTVEVQSAFKDPKKAPNPRSLMRIDTGCASGQESTAGQRNTYDGQPNDNALSHARATWTDGHGPSQIGSTHCDRNAQDEDDEYSDDDTVTDTEDEESGEIILPRGKLTFRTRQGRNYRVFHRGYLEPGEVAEMFRKLEELQREPQTPNTPSGSKQGGEKILRKMEISAYRPAEKGIREEHLDPKSVTVGKEGPWPHLAAFLRQPAFEPFLEEGLEFLVKPCIMLRLSCEGV